MYVPAMKSNPPPAIEVSDIRRALLEHYDRSRRSLPWRDATDPYRILVSEVMLQQTRVETVLGYYGRWLEQFPDLETLAAASEQAVLKAWEGLGYYRRARHLHRAARLVCERPDASLPSTYEELRELPGLGEYTAGAVASIAFGEVVAAADGNVRRVLARLFDERAPKPAWVRRTACALVDPERPGDWNQAMMDLGATICVPRTPRCGGCPVARWCEARAAGTAEQRPVAARRRPPRLTTLVVAALCREGRVLLARRPREGLLGGMWAFPEREISPDDDPPAVAAGIAADLGAALAAGPAPLPAHEHRFTHLHARYLPYLVPVESAEACSETEWVDPAGPTGLALPAAQRRILEAVGDRIGVGAA